MIVTQLPDGTVGEGGVTVGEVVGVNEGVGGTGVSVRVGVEVGARSLRTTGKYFSEVGGGVQPKGVKVVVGVGDGVAVEVGVEVEVGVSVGTSAWQV